MYHDSRFSRTNTCEDIRQWQGYKAATPLGAYNPDWAVLVEEEGAERLYFVVETKTSLFTEDPREKESAKIKCGEAHFNELGKHNSPAAQFIRAMKINDLMGYC